MQAVSLGWKYCHRMSRKLIVGGDGQDGRLLLERLLRNGDEVTSVGRRDIDLGDFAQVRELVESTQPDEIYFVAAFQHSSEDSRPESELELFRKSARVHVDGLMHFLEAIRTCRRGCRLFYAASSLVFGCPPSDVQDEATPIDPHCIYGITKASGMQCCHYYRATHGIFAACGILYNHESPLRKTNFVIPKIINGAVEIKRGSRIKIRLGSLSSRVDWGYAPDYVEAMIRILRLSEPEDFIIATGETHSVQEVAEIVFGLLGLDWREHVEESPDILTRRRTIMCGNSRRLREKTGWCPTVSFLEMLKLLLEGRLNG